MTLYRFSLSSLLVALVAFQNTYASINLDENQILKAVIEEYCNGLSCKDAQEKTKEQLNQEIEIAISTPSLHSVKTKIVQFGNVESFEYKSTFEFPFYTLIEPRIDYSFLKVINAHSIISNFDNTDIRNQISSQNLQLRI